MALGKGLDKMIPTDEEAMKESKQKTKPEVKEKIVEKEVIKEVIKEVPAENLLNLSDIEPNSNQPRKEFDKAALEELADSIKKHGVIEPIVVSKTGKTYRIIAGERRWRAARMAGLKKIPVVIKDYSDRERMEVALIENLQREDLNPIEEALAYQSLIDEYNMKQDEVADKVSKSRSAITNMLRLLKLSDKVKQLLLDGKISSGHARCLVVVEDEAVQYQTALSIVNEGLSVRETEQLIKSVNNILKGEDEKPKAKKEELSPAMQAVIKNISDVLKTSLGSKVTIKPTNNSKGKIEIEYVSSDDLERIVSIINAGSRH